MFIDINIYSINNKTDHISEKYIFIEKSKTKVNIFPILGRIWSRIRIGSVISRNGSEGPDPYQNETDPQHC